MVIMMVVVVVMVMVSYLLQVKYGALARGDGTLYLRLPK